MKKSFISIILVISLIAGLLPCKVYAGTIEDYPGAKKLNNHWDQNWMSYLPDEALLNELSIPGAHDATCCNVEDEWIYDEFARTQDYYTLGLLQSGVRYFDLRVEKEKGILYMCHAGIDCEDDDDNHLKLSTVVEEIMLPYLKRHSGEAIIIQVMVDDGGDDVEKMTYNYFKGLASEGKLYVGDHMPTLGDARGKLVMISRLKIDGEGNSAYEMGDGEYWALRARPYPEGDKTNRTLEKGFSFKSVEIWGQDKYDEDKGPKWEYVRNSLTGRLSAEYRKDDARKRGKNAVTIVYASLSYQDIKSTLLDIGISAAMAAAMGGGIFYAITLIVGVIDYDANFTWPREGAEKINPKLKNLLREHPDLHTGCLAVDFADSDISRLIYGTNFARRNKDPWNKYYKVTFDTRGGSKIASQDVLAGCSPVQPEDPVKEGYNFSGWYRSPEYKDNDFIYSFYLRIRRDTTIYAKWDKDTISYIDGQGNDMPARKVESVYAPLGHATIELKGSNRTGGWYAAQKSVNGNGTKLIVSGDVNLILCDGVNLNAYEGITVLKGSSLTIWAQSTNRRTMGEMEVVAHSDYAAIGGPMHGASAGSITINGGRILASGFGDAPAIGGAGAAVTFNGGSVEAYRTNERPGSEIYAPAIGGTGGSVTINGGYVRASTLGYAPAIGGVRKDAPTKVLITGGAVSASGGAAYASPAIGGGSENGSSDPSPSDVTITGGRVSAIAGHAGGPVIGGNGGGDIVITGGNINVQQLDSHYASTGIGGRGCTVDLSWTSETDSITSLSYAGNIVLHEKTPFHFRNEKNTLTSRAILSSTNKTILPKKYIGALKKVEYLAPTCMENGHEEYWIDSKDNLYADEYGEKPITEPVLIPATGHKWGKTEYTWGKDEKGVIGCQAKRTCLNDSRHFEAETVYVTTEEQKGDLCTDTGKRILTAAFKRDWAETQVRTEEIPGTAHTPADPVRENVIDATCEKAGSYDEVVYCSLCGAEISRENKTIEAPGHNWGAVTFEWSEDLSKCTATHTCRRDKAHVEAEAVNSVLSATKEETCEDIGKKTYTAEFTAEFIDDGSKTQTTSIEIPALGHDWGEWQVSIEPTETENGEEIRICSRGCVDTRVIPSLGHSHKLVEVKGEPKGCIKSGLKDHYKCEGCSALFEDAEGKHQTSLGSLRIPATGHKAGAPVEGDYTPADCTWAGGYNLVTYCEICGSHLTQTRVVIPPDPDAHVWGEWDITKEPTCEEKGSKTRVCAKDKSHVETVDIEPLGHDWSEWETVKEPTCEEAGISTRVCANDDSHIEKKEIPKLAHTAGKPVRESIVPASCDKEGSYDEVVYCSVCCAELSREKKTTEALGHDWGEWIVTKEATADEEGEEVRTCKNDPSHTEHRPIERTAAIISYRNVLGDGSVWKKGSDTELEMVFKRSVDDGTTFSHFAGIEVDGEEAASGNYSAESGSLKLYLKPEYLEQLALGKHVLRAEFDDGSADAEFTVAEADEEIEDPADNEDDSLQNDSAKTVETGDVNHLYMWLALAMLSLLALIGVTVCSGLIRKR